MGYQRCNLNPAGERFTPSKAHHIKPGNNVEADTHDLKMYNEIRGLVNTTVRCGNAETQ